MSSHRSEIGPLAAIFAFEASARLGSFTLAAAELGVSQAAVSKQIALLEERLGVPLFERKHRRIVPTANGEKLFIVTEAGLSSIAGTMREMRQTERRSVTIALSIAVTRFWLMPRLPNFTRLHPEIPIRVLSADDANLTPGLEIDLAIRYEATPPPINNAVPLFSAEVAAMASPRFIKRHQLRTVEDVLAAPRIAYDTPGSSWITWETWRQAAGVRQPIPDAALSVSHYQDAHNAAQRDQGVLLVWQSQNQILSETEGLLQIPGPRITVPGAFYLFCSDEPNNDVRTMMDWLMHGD